MRFIKPLVLIFLVLLFIVAFLFLRLFLPASLRAFWASRVLHIFNKIVVLLLGIKVKVSGKKYLKGARGVFLVSNHLSYLDGVIASSILPFVFIGRADLRHWPLFGLLSTFAETVFVNRANKNKLRRDIKKISWLLSRGVNVILFPEGTSSDGKLLPFKSNFFQAPLSVGSPIICLAIEYRRVNNEPLNARNKDLVYWYGDMNFFPHLLRVLSLKDIEVKVRIFPPLNIFSQVLHHSQARKKLSQACQEMIEAHFNYF